MSVKTKVTTGVMLVAAILLFFALYIHGHDVAVLNPQGVVAQKERSLMVTATLLGMIVIIPVYILTFTIAWKYRASNTKAKYTPTWDHHLGLEALWWLVPTIIIAILSVLTWTSSHALDPFKPLASNTKPLTVQVVALDWKWLFIYPEQNIASVNFVQFPQNTPINFEVTADAPMNSFWIPSLGGQIYAMAGMKTQLHLMASSTGDYKGVSANLSGNGFSGMEFVARSSSQSDFNAWVKTVKQSPAQLNLKTYNALAKPSQNNPRSYYSSEQAGLYDTIIMKYMVPVQGT